MERKEEFNPEDLVKGFVSESSELEDDEAETVAETDAAEDTSEEDAAEDTSEDTSEEDEGAENSGKKRSKSAEDRVKEINRATREMRERERRAEQAEARARELIADLEAKSGKKPLTSQKDGDTVGADEGPDPQDYNYGEMDPQFTRDLARFEARQEIAAADKTREKERQQAAASEKERELGTKLEEQVTKGRELFKDFDEVVLGVDSPLHDLPQLDDSVAEAVINSPVASEILYHMATNAEEAASFANSTPIEQARLLGKLEAKLSPSEKQAPPKTNKRTIKTPPSKVKAGSGASSSDDDDDFSAFWKKYGGDARN